jgi:tetratricopeptide (TPR) repeat protein
MQEIEPPTSRRSLRIDPRILHELQGMPGTDTQTLLAGNATQEGQQTPAQQAAASTQAGITDLRAGRFAAAQQHFDRAITLLQGQVPDTQLVPLLENRVRTVLQRDLSPQYALPGSSPTQLEEALPTLQRILDIGEATRETREALDRQHRATRPQNFMNVAHAQFVLGQHQASADNYLRAIQLLENCPGNNLHLNDMLRVSLNNYVFALRSLPETTARTQEIERRTEQLRAVMMRRAE